MGLNKIIKQYEILSLLNTYIKAGVLFYAIFVFLFVQKNKTGLEQFRDIMNNKLYHKLYKKYKTIIQKIPTDYDRRESNVQIPRKIWFCWMQGIENAPELVRACYNRLKQILSDFEVIVITRENYKQYTNIPSFIIEKWEKDIITTTHFSDILRNNLLLNSGGYWIDSTVFISSQIPKIIQKSQFFLFQSYKPGSNGKKVNLSSWFIGSVKDNPVLKLTQELLYTYWQKNSYLIDYFLYHNFLQMALNHYSDIKNAIPKYTNETTHFLLFELQKDFDKLRFEDICKQTFAHKLTYKLGNTLDKNCAGSFYEYLMRGELE